MPDIVCGDFVFVSDFDSSNIAHAEQVVRKEPANDGVDFEFNVWTHPDCAGTEFENNNRSWFYFGVTGGVPFATVKLNVVNLNRQCKMYSQGMAPVTRTSPGKLHWERIRDRPTFSMEDNIFTVSWKYRTLENLRAITYFAFTYPFSYTDLQASLRNIDIRFLKSTERGPRLKKTKKSINKRIDLSRKIQKKEKVQRHRLDDIYYKRETICLTCEGRKVDLLTITSYHGITSQREPRYAGLFPEKDVDRPFRFVGKKVIFLSARVHPGETPSSFVMNGVIQLLISRDDPVAISLRRLYVFKLMPMLNPDGVSHGHYRTDMRGVNLNRFYLNPSPLYQPSVYAAKAVILYHFNGNESEDLSMSVDSKSEKPPRITQSKSEDCFLSLSKDMSETPSSAPVRAIAFVDSKTSLSSAIPAMKVESMPEAMNVALEKLGPDGAPASKNIGSENLDLPQNPSVADPPVEIDFNSIKLELAAGGSAEPAKPAQIFSTEMVGAVGVIELKGQEEMKQGLIGNDCDNQGCDDKLGVSDASDVICKVEKVSQESESLSRETLSSLRLSPMQASVSQDSLLSPKLFAKKAPWTNQPKAGCESPDSELFLYVDFHGHASKKGIFMYGNHFSNTLDQVECMLLPKLMSINSQNFHFNACNFTEKNMYLRDRRDGLSREGSGRVAVWKTTGLLKSYTLECNYNTGRLVNTLPPPLRSLEKRHHNLLVPPKYTPQVFEEIGKALGASILDLTGSNPNSRLANSEYYSLNGVRDWLKLQQIAENNLTALQRTVVNKQFKKLTGSQPPKSDDPANAENVPLACSSKLPSDSKAGIKVANLTLDKKENIVLSVNQQNKKLRQKTSKINSILQVRAKCATINAIPGSSKGIAKPKPSVTENVIVKKGPKRIKISEDGKIKWGKLVASTSKRKDSKLDENASLLWKSTSRLEKKSSADGSRRFVTPEKRRKKSKPK
ncbi:unnamed protein product [Bemisia tabaci]|uniref:Peptidase M14 domain-containing protein n=1 Tax=Bemisia tabaci TaxID=7038 RepID=A0A9P0F434_BEMTA|nr:unnamed protein product [Bemisia tabaci]